MPPRVSNPPINDPDKGSQAWIRWYKEVAAGVSTGSAPANAQYLVATANGDLTAERNLGLLASGYLKLAVALGVATPSTTAAVPASDLSGVVPIANGGTNSATALAGDSIMVSDGSKIVQGPAGTTTTVLHGNAVGPATYGSVVLSTDVSGLLPTGAGGTGTNTPSGIWTPTLFNTTNVAASTAYSCQYMRVGSSVSFSGKVDIDPTAAADTVLGLSLPVASVFANDNELGGTAIAPVTSESAALLADVVNARMTLRFLAADTANRSWWFSGLYRVI